MDPVFLPAVRKRLDQILAMFPTFASDLPDTISYDGSPYDSLPSLGACVCSVDKTTIVIESFVYGGIRMVPTMSFILPIGAGDIRIMECSAYPDGQADPNNPHNGVYLAIANAGTPSFSLVAVRLGRTLTELYAARGR